MKKVVIIASTLSLSLLYTSCKKLDKHISPEDSLKIVNKWDDKRDPLDSLSGTPNCDSLKVDFMAGQHTDIGSIVVTADSSNLYVTYNTEGGWVLKETQLYVGSLSAMPQTPTGNPKIGNFPYKTSHTSPTTSYTYTVPRSNFAGASCVAIVPHAATQLIGPNGEELKGETAWGAGTQLNTSGSWAMYFTYCFCNNNEDNGNEGNGSDTTNVGGIEGN